MPINSFQSPKRPQVFLCLWVSLFWTFHILPLAWGFWKPILLSKISLRLHMLLQDSFQHLEEVETENYRGREAIWLRNFIFSSYTMELEKWQDNVSGRAILSNKWHLLPIIRSRSLSTSANCILIAESPRKTTQSGAGWNYDICHTERDSSRSLLWGWGNISLLWPMSPTWQLTQGNCTVAQWPCPLPRRDRYSSENGQMP